MMKKSNIDNIMWNDGKVTYEERCKILKQRGGVIWFTGISGAGKSTIAIEVERGLANLGRLVYRLDGDNIRHGLCSNLGFSKVDRNENIRRVAEVAALFKDAGIITLVSFISPFKKMRQFAKDRVGSENYVEVYVKADLETCIKRDTKGLYKKAIKGEISNFTAVSSPYEKPDNPDLVIDTTKMSIDKACEVVITYVLDYFK